MAIVASGTQGAPSYHENLIGIKQDKAPFNSFHIFKMKSHFPYKFH